MASSPRSAERAGPIVLVGMPGSGKTTAAVELAAVLGRQAVDLDQRIEAAAGRSIPEVFATDGEDAFRRWESKVLGEVLASPTPVVVAAGGGVVTRPENVERMRAAGATVVWLRAAPETLLARVGDGEGRPLLAGDAAGALRRLAEERAPLYEAAADVVVDIDGLSPREIAERVA